MCVVYRLICKFFSSKYKCQAEVTGAAFEIGDHPICNYTNDDFKVQERIVNKIYQDLSSIHGQLTIAITGEWGIGKTSVMNLLENKLTEAGDKNIIIKFDPQIEGKFEISDLIGAFYLKLYQKIGDKKIKDSLVKSLKAISVLSNVDIKGSIGIPGLLEVSASYNPAKKIDELIELFEKTKPKEFFLQAKELNQLLKERKLKLHIIIDEIDRLPEPYIVNFLLFCRTLEVFDNLICLVGVDYEQVLNKLMHERTGSQSQTSQIRYSNAKNYLDKLFQIKYQIHHDIYTLSAYVIDQIKIIDFENALAMFYTSDDREQYDFIGLISYLATPRRIKKWLISLKLNYSIIKNSHKNKFSFMAFLAVTIKHPVVMDNLSKNISILFNRHRSILYAYVNDKFGVSFAEKDNNDILLAAFGAIGSPNTKNGLNNNRRKSLEELIELFGAQFICDPLSSEYLFNFLNIPTYLILLFVRGVISQEHVSLFEDYFNGKIDVALGTLLENDLIVDVSAKDLAEVLYKGGVGPSQIPTLAIINELWSRKVNDRDIYFSIIAKKSLRKIPIENIINECPLGLSESYLNDTLRMCRVKNKKGDYNLSEFQGPEPEVIHKEYLHDVKFEDKLIKEFSVNTLKNMLVKWLNKFESDFQLSDGKIFFQKSIISIFFRYIQWGRSIDGRDNRDKLALYVLSFLQNKSIDERDKGFLKNALNNEIAKESKDGFLGRGDIMQDLFNDKAREILFLIT